MSLQCIRNHKILCAETPEAKKFCEEKDMCIRLNIQRVIERGRKKHV
jgi:hypothetical protein